MIKAVFLFFPLLLISCASINGRANLAASIAENHLERSEVKAGQFKLLKYQRITNHDEANIYIEGDGLAWISPNQQSLNPTPTNPIALRLASEDNSANVIYFARPCQYVKLDDSCGQEYWGTKRFAPEVINGYMQALDDLGFKKINLFGFSGGGGVATILAARRSDVASLRTIAGNIDIAKFTQIHNVSPMSGSINPADEAAKTAAIPQIHFVGAEDKVVPQSIYTSFKKAAGESSCIKMHLLKATTHEHGWEENWPELIKEKPGC